MKTIDLEQEDSAVMAIKRLNELENFFLGKKLGQGHARIVFEHKHDTELAIKFDYDGGRANWLEWEIWQEARNWQGKLLPYKNWLCPCHYISPCGTFMIVSKAEKLPTKLIPKKIPSFLTDQNLANFGLIGKKVVCLDYEFIPVMTMANNLRMVKSSIS